MPFRKTPLWLAIGVTVAPLTQADQRLDTLQVTANRLPQTRADVLASTTIIDRDEIERLQPNSVTELLQGRAGVELARNGARGNQTSLFLRGTNSDHALVLVDGARIASATDGSINWEFLPVAAIQRIEIVRGPRAAAYGADAIGGVINIITRQAETGGEHATLELRAGGEHTRRETAWFSATQKDTRLSALIDHQSTDGFSARADGGDDDGFDQRTGKLAMSHAFGERADLDVSLLRTRNDYDYDDCGYPPSQDCRGEGDQQVLSASLTTHNRPGWDTELAVARVTESRERFIDGRSSGETSTRRNEASLTNRLSGDWGETALGADVRDASLDSPLTYAEDGRRNWGVFANWHQRLARHRLSAGIRHDDDNRFGGATTGSLAYAYALTDAQQIGASYATAYKAPSLLDLYGPYGANPDLDAETSRTGELFWRLDRETWGLSATAFDTRIDDLIDYDPATFIPYNVGKARIRGVELAGDWQYGGFTLHAALTHQNPENRETGERLKRRARTFGRLDADYATGDWSFGATLRSAGDRRDTNAVTFADTTTAGYAVMDLRTTWRLTPRIALSAKLDNALDRDYQLVDGYNTQGRYLEGGITLRL
ncbi:TonB-dependent receptor [Modicisalibacter tunisiensis]|uniref:TonB-dependent receptor domain-containing protein n=1 Tax=Modicisalibacter tunisiensis TaxID=390637 RepID=UPI001CCB1B34|nr:TonB-dependent receptor [Modicisalibacter tunisiensis]MBZ9537871.1 TonB-dependent receptor [Modicisalibacter tunisiensis]